MLFGMPKEGLIAELLFIEPDGDDLGRTNPSRLGGRDAFERP